jgi:hypothetical protein
MPQYITGDKGSVTFSSGETIQVADIGAWQATISRNVFSTTPFGYKIGRVTLGRNTIQGSFVGFFNGTNTPPIPANGTNAATLRLSINDTSRYYDFPARIFSLGIGANSIEGGPIQQQYGFVSCAEAAGTDITVA